MPKLFQSHFPKEMYIFTMKNNNSMKKLVFLSLICLSIGISAQEFTPNEDNKKDTTFWRTDIKTGLTFNSVKLYNWKGGGIESTSIGALALGKTTYQREKVEWVSQMDLQYGSLKNDGQDDFRKSVDKLSLDSKFAYRLTMAISIMRMIRRWRYRILWHLPISLRHGGESTSQTTFSM